MTLAMAATDRSVPIAPLVAHGGPAGAGAQVPDDDGGPLRLRS